MSETVLDLVFFLLFFLPPDTSRHQLSPSSPALCLQTCAVFFFFPHCRKYARPQCGLDISENNKQRKTGKKNKRCSRVSCVPECLVAATNLNSGQNSNSTKIKVALYYDRCQLSTYFFLNVFRVRLLSFSLSVLAS